MTRNEMEQCISLRAEIKAIEESMKSPKSTYVTVFYKDYRTGKGIPKSLEGLDNGEEQLRELKAYHKNRCRKLLRRLKQAEKFIEGIEDSEMRTILRMYYINGSNQQEIADTLNYDQASISRKLDRFWKREKYKMHTMHKKTVR